MGEPNQNNAPGLVVALDGPAGSGKSTVAKQVASTLGLSYLDTGAMYRAATVRLLQLGVDLDNQELAAQRVSQMRFEPASDPSSGSIVVDETEVKGLIRSENVSALVSKVATNLKIRKVMVSLQKEIISQARLNGIGVVAEGRDITTVVAPDADVRAIITASPETRLLRRAGELGKSASAKELQDQVLRRDKDDATVSQFETPAPGVTLIDTTDLSIAEAVEAVVALAPHF